MSSRKRSRSRDRLKSSKLRMDSKASSARNFDPGMPSSRRREIDNVMKKARASPNSYWDKKLLEVEAKDPNRWRHSGYKSMYLDGSSSPSSGRRSRSRSGNRRGSPPVNRRSPRSPPLSGRRSPRSPPPRRSPPNRRSPPPSRLQRPRSPYRSSNAPQASRRSPSGSSMSSCSDDSCSVCSPKLRARSRSRSMSPHRNRKVHGRKEHGGKKNVRHRPPSPSPSPPVSSRRVPRPMTPPPQRRLTRPTPSTSSSDKPTDPRRQPPPPRPRNRSGEIIDVSGVKPPPPKGTRKANKEKEPVLLTRIKKERGTKKRPGSPGGDSSASEDSSDASTSPIVATTRLTLSERFGKMAQWSVDRERRDIENMKITKTGGDLKVMIEEDDFLYGSPPRRYSISPVPAGHFPDELLGNGHSRMAGWDDVRVRYQYYKDLGYLRDLTMDDYIKWEEWWYKYQDWLANERHYEHWAAQQASRRRRGGSKRIPATQRLN